MGSDKCSSGLSAPCDTVAGTSSCCVQPYPLTNEALAQCCGVLKSLKVCLSPASTVGVVGGYVSLWFSLCQAVYSVAAYLYLGRAAQRRRAADDKAAGEDVGMISSGERGLELAATKGIVTEWAVEEN